MDKNLLDDCANLDGVYINSRQNMLEITTEQNQQNFTKYIYIYIYFVRKKSIMFS